MSRRLPPLNALRAFEAAARHLSFTRAAEELNVTQAAISHQVKALEERLGQPLFKRRNRTLILTDAAQGFLPALRDAFDMIDKATQRLHSAGAAEKTGGPVAVSTVLSLAASWLVPRLGRFHALHPEIDVRISTEERLIDFEREDEFDFGIRYGRGEYPGLRVDRMMTEDLFPVCSPKLRDGPHPLRQLADLRHQMLLHDDMRTDWRMWLLAAGLTDIDPKRGHFFDSSSLVLRAAIEGQGVALGRSALVGEALDSGQLVRPFELSLPSEYAYYLVGPEDRADWPKVKAFREWILAEAAAP